MKKINLMLRNVNVQGNLVVGVIFTLIIALSILTWGK
jgi:hypothetical protein